ncbi:MAG TPA: hypothetical protein VHD62_12935 [Opitutaceae bacterium]|nr:hypothetical protein [Opitutaceae bacterium]
MNPPDEQKLERVIHVALREVPPRRAPATLEGRVMAEIARRAALPWWKKSFAHWPMAARIGFVLASAGVIKVVLLAVVFVLNGFDAARFREIFAPQFARLQALASLGRVAGDFVAGILGGIPPLWLYGGLATVATLYVAFFGLGTIAYRTLYAER